MNPIHRHAALLIIDMQQGIHHPKLGRRNNPRAEENMASLLASWRLTQRPIEKNVPDAFIATGLERWLHVREIDQLVLMGVVTNNSVESTARSAGNLGFKTIVIADATFTFDLRDINGRLWAAEDVHALSLSNLAMDYASVYTAEEVINRLQ